jgi:hypothetical protein
VAILGIGGPGHFAKVGIDTVAMTPASKRKRWHFASIVQVGIGAVLPHN